MSAAKRAPEAKEPGVKGSDDRFAPAKSAIVASTRKEPPPEKPESTRLRYLVLLSFWAIVILLGLPVWWATTSIYRAPLPMEQMMDWADGKVRLNFPKRQRGQLTAPGMQTRFPTANINRGTFVTRSRSAASSAKHSACPRRPK
jgi:hypothetical protein